MSIQENTLVFRRSLLHLVVIGSIIHQSISFLSRGHSTPLCPALPCVTLLREALVYFFLQKSVPIQPKTSNILPKFCQKLATTPKLATRPRRVEGRAEERPERRRGEFWQIFITILANLARFRLYRHRFLQVNTRFEAFFKI